MTRISNAVLVISYPALSIASTHSATLRKGTQDDPDALDPALSGTCVGSIIFTSLCDKLVDISHDLKIVVKMFIPSQFPDQNHRRQPRDQQVHPACTDAVHGEHDPSAPLRLTSSPTSPTKPPHMQSRPTHHRSLSTRLPSSPTRTARPAVNWVLNP